MSSWNEGGGIKIERAEEHIRDLKARMDAFFEKYPNSIAKDSHTKTGDCVIFVHYDKPADPAWGAVVGDVLHNLRSGLNMLWRHVCANAGSPVRDNTDFPIHASAEGYDAMLRRKSKTRMQEVMEIYAAFKPHRGGDDSLWLLHDLNNADKHQLVTMTNRAMSYGRATVTISPDVPHNVPVFFPNVELLGRAISAEEGTPLYAIRAGYMDKVDVHTEITTVVAFVKPEIVRGLVVIPTLRNFAGAVDGVIQAFRKAGFVA